MTSTCLSNKNQSLIVIIETTQGKEDNIILANGNGLKKILCVSALTSISSTRAAPLDNILVSAAMP